MFSAQIKKLAAVLSMAAGAGIALATPALAATFTQSGVNFSNSWESENPYSSSAGGHSVKARMICDPAATPSVELVQDFWFEPNNYLGQRSLACQSWRTVGWSSDDSGDHFLIFRYGGGATIEQFTWTYPY